MSGKLVANIILKVFFSEELKKLYKLLEIGFRSNLNTFINITLLLFKRLLQTHSPYIITEKIKTLYKYYQ